MPETGSRRALTGLSAAALLVAILPAPGLAQQTNAPAESPAHQAGMFEAFRSCLRQDHEAGLLSDAVYQRCDATADRLYFGLYNTHYKGPRSPVSQSFVNEAQKIVNDVVANPGLCKADADFNGVGAAITEDARGFYADHPQLLACIPCKCAIPNLSSPALTPIHPFKAAKLPDLHHVLVYPNYCLGQAMQGIMFVPQSTPIAPRPGASQDAAPQVCAAKDVHIRQFISTHCAIPGTCDDTLKTTCGERKFDTWYLDECPAPAPRHLVPDQDATDTSPHVISDEPTPNLPTAGSARLTMTFHDVVMCGDSVVLEALTWTRTGAPTPQWCVTRNGNPKVTGGARYSNVSAEDPISGPVRTAVCEAGKNRDLKQDTGIETIRKNFGGCPDGN